MLEIKNLSCRRGEKILWQGLEFSLSAGEILLLRGPNGCGKSSLLRLLATIGRPDAVVKTDKNPYISWQNQDIYANADTLVRYRADLFYLGHDLALKEDLSGRDHLVLSGNSKNPDGVENWLADMVLDAPVATYSAGQRQKLALLRLFQSGARLWLMDEPTSALDGEASARFYQRMFTHCQKGGMAVMATHSPLLLGADHAKVSGDSVKDFGRIQELHFAGADSSFAAPAPAASISISSL